MKTPRHCVLCKAGRSPDRRPLRVASALAGVVILSGFDLSRTLAHMADGTMFEGNPIARVLVESGAAGALAAWKGATVGLSVGLLYRLRRRAAAEFGAVLSLIVVGVVALMWTRYDSIMSGVGPCTAASAGARPQPVRAVTRALPRPETARAPDAHRAARPDTAGFALLLARFQAGDSGADLNADGLLDVRDVEQWRREHMEFVGDVAGGPLRPR